MFKNPKTSIAGIAAWLVVFFGALSAELDNDPKTEPNWNIVISTGITGIGLLIAQDAKK